MTGTLRRSQFAAPGNADEVVADALGDDPDAVLLDLEDSLGPGEKTDARAALIDVVTDHAWEETTLSYRINGTDTRWWYEDVVAVVEAAGDAVDELVVPKVRDASDVRAVETLLSSVERNADLGSGVVDIAVQVETATGMNNVVDILQASDRLSAVVFGPADYVASVGAVRGATDYPGHYWHYPLSRVSHAAAGAGLVKVGGPYTDDTPEGFRNACRLERDLGYDGKVVVHPDQIAVANEVFSPDPDQIQRARRIVAEYDAADRDGVAAIDGNVIDAQTYRMARRLLSRAEQADLL